MACRDELSSCATSPFLRITDADNSTSSCRWPLAELCLKTCGECPRVTAARLCASLADECSWEFCDGESVSWRRFFTRVVADAPAGARILSEEKPWVAEFPGFLSDAEADEIIRIGTSVGLRREDDLDDRVRNVSVNNCDSVHCISQPFINELYARVSRLLRLPARNFESMEFLHYERGQHYTWHRDEFGWKASSPEPAMVLAGPRVLTLFFYLSDVQRGGETAFAGAPHDTKISDSRFGSSRVVPSLLVRPQRGKAIMWANMANEWHMSEPASSHRALSVEQGTKWAATLWVHASGFRIPEMYAGPECSVRPPLQ